MFPGKQTAYLAKEYHMYLMPNGRANLCALNNNNLDRFAQAVHDTITRETD
jgi:aspartate aminotransferase